ncbi:MAG: cytochrome c4 [Burkholderiaceae bacterium]|nr:MAG: cytochrome c4 [Burkholderiaceae bacterium]
MNLNLHRISALVLWFAVAIPGLAGAAEAAAAKKVDIAKGEQIVAAQCAACHTTDGNSAIPANPKLAGQHAAYIYKQLNNFVAKDGKPAERANGVMSSMAAPLSDDDMHNVAAYFAAQTMKIGAAKAGKASAELGQKIYRGGIAEKNVAACAACHGPTGAGIPAQFPRLGGQHAEYTEAQLKAFRDASYTEEQRKAMTNAAPRKNGPQMASIAARMTDAEIKAVADYIAGLK